MPEHAPSLGGGFDAVALCSPQAGARLGGMRLIERMLFTLARAGADRILCVGPRPAGRLRMPDVPVTWSADGADAAAWARGRGPLVVADAAAIVDGAIIEALARAPIPGTLAAAGPVRLWRCDEATLPALVPDPNGAPGLGDAAPWAPPRDGLLARADTPAARRDAEEALLGRLGRPGDGWFTRVFDRRISRLLTRVLLPTGITPNLVTAVGISIGIGAGLAFAAGSPALAIVGALAFLLSTIVDGCDGEIARLTFRESRLGARLDLAGDNLVHLVLFGGIAWGLHRRSPDGHVVLLGVLLIGGVVLSMATVYRCILQRPPTPGQRTLYEAFASREFAYLLAALTLAGHLEWFLWLAVAGTYAFAGGLLWLGRSRALVEQEVEGG